jgi:hypothetical protein
LYPVVHAPEAETNDLIRVIDESGEDDVYPARLFQKLKLPGEVQRALRLASVRSGFELASPTFYGCSRYPECDFVAGQAAAGEVSGMRIELHDREMAEGEPVAQCPNGECQHKRVLPQVEATA